VRRPFCLFLDWEKENKEWGVCRGTWGEEKTGGPRAIWEVPIGFSWKEKKRHKKGGSRTNPFCGKGIKRVGWESRERTLKGPYRRGISPPLKGGRDEMDVQGRGLGSQIRKRPMEWIGKSSDRPKNRPSRDGKR